MVVISWWLLPLPACPVSSILDFSASINPLGLLESALTAIKSHLTSLTRYPDPCVLAVAFCPRRNGTISGQIGFSPAMVGRVINLGPVGN
ncbi:MAG UNVERIFIED_CONTAM: hypothetical protein LVR29_14360 [Microcystis novacekii LVE1205-3]|jgi:hypothetical protein